MRGHILLVLSALPSVNAAQFVLFDVTFTYTKADAGTSMPNRSHYYVKGAALNPDRPRDWTSPVDYRNGTVHIRAEVIEKPPGGEETTWTLCYIPHQGQGNGYGCTGTGLYQEKGVYERDVPMTSWWENGSIVWTQGIKQMDLVIKDNSGGQGHAHRRPDHEKFFPTKMRITMVQVAAGSTYDPSLVPNLAPAEFAERLENWKALSPVTLQADLHHVQGIDVEHGVLWVSSVDAAARVGYVSRFELPSGRLLNQVQVQHGQRFHPGGLTLDGDSIWVPVAEYDRDGPTAIERRDKRTLALISSFTVNDHIGCIAAGRDGLVGGNWDSRIFYRWSREGVEDSRSPNPSATRYQDLKMVGDLLLGSGLQTKGQGSIEWLEGKSFGLRRRVMVGQTSRGVTYTQEGMTYRDGLLYLLPEDGRSRLFTFAQPTQPRN